MVTSDWLGKTILVGTAGQTGMVPGVHFILTRSVGVTGIQLQKSLLDKVTIVK
jgi:hypothetical protein